MEQEIKNAIAALVLLRRELPTESNKIAQVNKMLDGLYDMLYELHKSQR